MKVIDSKTKKPVAKVKLILKVYTGKKYKKYSLKTDKKGIVSFNMKSLPKGKHKVVINIKSNSKVKLMELKSGLDFLFFVCFVFNLRSQGR